MERRGEKSDRGNLKREAERVNALMAQRAALDKEIAQERQRRQRPQAQPEPEKQPPNWNRDRANEAWENAVMNAAIEREKKRQPEPAPAPPPMHVPQTPPPSPPLARKRGDPPFIQDILLSDRATWWQRGALKLGRMASSLSEALERKLEQHRLEHGPESADITGPPQDSSPHPAWPQPESAEPGHPAVPPRAPEDWSWPAATEHYEPEPDIGQDRDDGYDR